MKVCMRVCMRSMCDNTDGFASLYLKNQGELEDVSSGCDVGNVHDCGTGPPKDMLPGPSNNPRLPV